MDRLINIINSNYQNILIDKFGIHTFFRNASWWKHSIKNYFEFQHEKNYKEIIKYDPNIDLLKIKFLEDCKYIPKKIITKELLEDIYTIISNPNKNDFRLIYKLLLKMYDYYIPSNIPNIDKWKVHEESNVINVLIMGAGPLGLYTALYLNEYYNIKQEAINGIKVNILIIDNRIKEEGIRLPYTRITEFGFDITEMQPFIKQIFCWKNQHVDEVRKFDFINVLENLLYLAAFNKNISMYYTKKLEDFKDVKKFIDKHDINYLFDCSGGRLKNNLNEDLDWNKYSFKKDNYEILLNKNKTHYEFYKDGKLDEHKNVVIYLLDKNKKPIPIGNNLLSYIDNDDDIELINEFNNKCMTIKDYFIFSRKLKSKFLRNMIYDAIRSKISPVNVKISEIKYVKISKYDQIIKHKKFCATKINDKCVYIGLGDTLGSSDLGILFGMKHSILLSKHICNLLSSVKYF